jgi:hypothetical protein
MPPRASRSQSATPWNVSTTVPAVAVSRRIMPFAPEVAPGLTMS